MEFNDTKCHHLHIGKHDTDLNYTIEKQDRECIITKVDSEKDLGVTSDKNLNFREHISTKIIYCQQKPRHNIQNLYLP